MRIRINIFFVFLGFLLIINKLNAIPAANDHCVVHLDKSFYVTGEVIWFKIYLPKAYSGNPFAMRVVVLDKNGEVADYFFLPTEGKTYADGYYKIPFDRESGMYHLVFVGQEKTTKRPVMLAKVPVPIYNDLEKLNAPAIAPVGNKEENSSNLGDLKIEIRLDKGAYKSREAIQATVIVKDQSGLPIKANLSVAVTDWALVGDEVLNKPTVEEGLALTTLALDNNIYARIELAESVEKQNQNLVGIYIPEDWRMTYASPDKDGLFFIEMAPFFGEKSIQFLGYPNPDIEVQMDDPLRASPSSPLVYTEGILKYLEFSRERKKIFQLYTTLETNLEFNSTEEEAQPVPPDKSIRVADYEHFEDMATFFKEVNSPLAFKLDRKTNRYTARIFNRGAQEYYPGDPIFIIDGKVTHDADFVARLKTNQIEQVDLYSKFDKLFANFQVLGSNGVIIMTTKSGIILPPEEEADIFKIKGLEPPVAFPEFRPEQLNNNTHQPFFRPQLYWNPALDTDANGQATFTFFQTDDLGTFRIEVVAQGEDGSIGQGQKNYKVGWK